MVVNCNRVMLSFSNIIYKYENKYIKLCSTLKFITESIAHIFFIFNIFFEIT